MMDWRTLICAAARGAIALPLMARAQQHTSMPIVGFLHGASPDSQATHLAAFREGLGQVGYVEGRNVTIEYHWAEGRFDRFPELAVAETVLLRLITAGASVGQDRRLGADRRIGSRRPIGHERDIRATGGDGHG